ncbi:MAG: TIGR02206 family membrane protein [bacterium]
MAPTQFVTFGAQHFLAVAVSLSGAAGLAVGVRASGSARLDRAVRWLLAGTCVVYEVGALGWRWHSEFGGPAEALPLHLCDLSLLLAPVVLLTGRRPAYELLYFWGIGGAAQSLATPTLIDGFPARTCLSFFFGHALIIASALYATVVLRLRPVPRSLLRVWLITTTYAVVLLPVNYWLDTNYLYIAGKPLTPSLLDWLGPWPWYILSLQPIAVAVLVLCYLPFFVLDRLRG